ncbi:MAG TPA: 2-succinyl-5-enolpyruvyl-6-hydroxy-3-cyclohexene-1-carboxylic-acid synthase [Acidimicrobiia bacterium]|nr:2-succinyl-5-enolpyruvyl-6-hydroxy-3-cyclohexene-1-carboxylic-acid synthase [Acidimicrobiia bacterium]
MSYPNPSTALARIVVDELARGGVGRVVAAPGSRSTALALAAAQAPDLDLVVALDERSAAFHALGWAKASGRPAAVLTTSGTAVANLLPAVVEADLSATPLIVLSSDRPAELRGVGANQTIDQVGIFGGSIRFVLDLGPGESHPDAPRWWRSMVAQGLGKAAGFGSRPGPVQFNLAFREPTVPVADDGRSRVEPYPYDEPGRDGRPWTTVARARSPDPEVVATVADAVSGVERGVVVAGAGVAGKRAIADLGEVLGWPVLATAESGLRGSTALATGHHLAGRVRPEVVLRFGGPGPSRNMIDLVSGPARQIVVAPTWSDPGRVADLIVDGDPAAVAAGLAARVEAREAGEWMQWWKTADSALRRSLEPELAGGLTEPAVAAITGRLPAERMVVASSMPIRDVENYAFEVPPIVANRGASGIDGLVSTALGVAGGGFRTLALSGDLSLLYDSNGFLCRPRPPCVFVVIDNGGGGIFSFLPQARHAGGDFERLFATPPGRRLDLLAEFHQLEHHSAGDAASLEGAVAKGWEAEGGALVVVESERDANVVEHQRLARVVDEALASLTPPG